MSTHRQVTLVNLLLWVVQAVIVSIVFLYLTELFGVPFVREAGGRIV